MDEASCLKPFISPPHCVCARGGHTQDCVFLYYNSLANGTTARFGKVAGYALAGSWCLTAVMGAAG